MILDEEYGIKVAVSPEQYEEIKKSKIIEENKILKELQEELDKYEERINKAIEYINVLKETTPSSPRKDYAKMILINYGDLLDILKGENNE